MRFLHDGFISGHIAKRIQQSEPRYGEGRFYFAEIEIKIFRAVFEVFIFVDEFFKSLFKVGILRAVGICLCGRCVLLLALDDLLDGGVGAKDLFKESGGKTVIFAEGFAIGALYDRLGAVFPEDDGCGRAKDDAVYMEGIIGFVFYHFEISFIGREMERHCSNDFEGFGRDVDFIAMSDVARCAGARCLAEDDGDRVSIHGQIIIFRHSVFSLCKHGLLRHEGSIFGHGIGADERGNEVFLVPRELVEVTFVRLIDAAAVAAIDAFDEAGESGVARLDDAQVGFFHDDGAIGEADDGGISAHIVLADLFAVLRLARMGDDDDVRAIAQGEALECVAEAALGSGFFI